MPTRDLQYISEKFKSFTQKPTKFLTVQTEVKEDIKNLVKDLYNFTKSSEKAAKQPQGSALPELIVNDFDEEQIWQQIELQNNGCWDHLVWEVANSISNKNELQFPIQIPDDSPEDSLQEDDEDVDQNKESDNESNDDENRISNEQKLNKTKLKHKQKPSIVDDQFFKLQEMEQFLLKEERNDRKPGGGSDDESIDLFEEIDDEDGSDDEDGGSKNPKYADFFMNDDQNEPENKPSKRKEKVKKVSFADDDGEGDESFGSENEVDDSFPNDYDIPMEASSGDDDESMDSDVEESNTIQQKPNEKKSDFELRQQRLKQQISKLEEKTLAEAPWQLKGEVDALRRPQNSLLENVVDFDLTTRPAPIITEQTTVTLEDIIRQRIKDKAWDDVERKEKPIEDQLAFKKTEVLDHAKSKQSLAQVYEAEYLKQKQSLTEDNDTEKEPESHKEIREAMDKLFSKLDALCHYHYTPKPAQPEVKIVSNTPAIMMEEVAPVSVSNAALLAPEEVKKKRKGELISKEERTATDRKRERRQKKQLQKKKGGVSKVTDQRNTKKATETNSDKTLKTSKAFFQELNDNTTSLIKNKRNIKNKGQ